MHAILQVFRPIPRNTSRLPDTSHNHLETKQLLQKEKGFTLIEILIVIVVIGILASIAIGVNLRIREQAIIGSIESDLSHAFKVSVIFFSDHPDNELTLALLKAGGYSTSEDVIVDVVDGFCDSLRITGIHPNIIETYEVDNTGNIFKQ